MNAHERREALLGWLRRQACGTAASAATHFGVTERTILRDIKVLRERGEPIQSSSGPGGGFYLARSARLAAVRLTLEEVLGLALAANVARQIGTGLPYSTSADHALDRLIRTLPEERAQRFGRLIKRLVVGPPATLNMHAQLGVVEPGLLDQFEQALAECRRLSFTYTDRHEQHTTRVIEPHGLLLRMPIWYVVAHDPWRDAPRMFRVDRMSEVTLCEEQFDPKPDAYFADYLEPCPWTCEASAAPHSIAKPSSTLGSVESTSPS